jgi:hypothetical protein
VVIFPIKFGGHFGHSFIFNLNSDVRFEIFRGKLSDLHPEMSYRILTIGFRALERKKTYTQCFGTASLWCGSDPGPAFVFDADPDPTFQFHPDPTHLYLAFLLVTVLIIICWLRWWRTSTCRGASSATWMWPNRCSSTLSRRKGRRLPPHSWVI